MYLDLNSVRYIRISVILVYSVDSVPAVFPGQQFNVSSENYLQE